MNQLNTEQTAVVESTAKHPGFQIHLPRAAKRFGPFLSKSRKRRRHRVRQWREKQRQDMEATVIDSMDVERDNDTGLNFLVTKIHDKRTGIKRNSVQVI